MLRFTNRISDYFDDSEVHASDPVGLHHESARHYDPTIGRWMNEEPIRFEADADLHSYPGNSPE